MYEQHLKVTLEQNICTGKKYLLGNFPLLPPIHCLNEVHVPSIFKQTSFPSIFAMLYDSGGMPLMPLLAPLSLAHPIPTSPHPLLVSVYWACSILCWLCTHSYPYQPPCLSPQSWSIKAFVGITFYTPPNFSPTFDSLTKAESQSTEGQKWHLGPRWDYHFPGAPLAPPPPSLPLSVCSSPRSVHNCHPSANSLTSDVLIRSWVIIGVTDVSWGGPDLGFGHSPILLDRLRQKSMKRYRNIFKKILDLVIHLFSWTDWSRGHCGSDSVIETLMLDQTSPDLSTLHDTPREENI